ncbi:hypothetical protein ACFLVX_04375 [Chloroflexota bacterium]
MNKPSVTPGIGFLNFAWPGLGLRVLAERYTDDLYAELTTCTVRSKTSCPTNRTSEKPL